jgi:hypothetical protein
METDRVHVLESTAVEGPCPRCSEPLRAVHTVSRYGRPTVALLECARCRYTCQAVVHAMWPDEAFPRTPSSAR